MFYALGRFEGAVDFGKCLKEAIMFGLSKKTEIPTDETALVGRTDAIATEDLHFLNGNPLKGPTLMVSKWSYSAWGAFGASSGCSGVFRASG